MLIFLLSFVCGAVTTAINPLESVSENLAFAPDIHQPVEQAIVEMTVVQTEGLNSNGVLANNQETVLPPNYLDRERQSAAIPRTSRIAQNHQQGEWHDVYVEAQRNRAIWDKCNAVFCNQKSLFCYGVCFGVVSIVGLILLFHFHPTSANNTCSEVSYDKNKIPHQSLANGCGELCGWNEAMRCCAYFFENQMLSHCCGRGGLACRG